MELSQANFLGTVVGLLFLMVGFTTAGFFNRSLGTLMATISLSVGHPVLLLAESVNKYILRISE